MTILSRYRPRFVHSLVYMLQASEYNVRDYLAWYQRTSDFAHVEKRKSIVWTKKAKALHAISWGFIIFWIVALMGFAHATGSDVPLVVLGGIVLMLPFYFPYVLALIALIMNEAQKPLEARMIREARVLLAQHKGLKIGIAGSYGKTTLREILKTILSQGKHVVAPPGSYNTPLGIALFVKTLQGNEDVIIFELGEYYPDDIRKLCDLVRPDIGIITGVNEAHLEKFGTLENTADTIFELADYLQDRPLYINAENALARSRSSAEDTLFSREAAGEWRISGVQMDLRGTMFRMVCGGEIIRASSRLLGVHMIGPIAAAAAIARDLGLTIVEIEEGIKKTKAFDHRMQMTVDNTGVITLDDSYNGSPDGVSAVIEFLASLEGHRRWYVTPGLVEMGSRTEVVHREIGRQLAEAGIEKVLLIQTSVTPHIEAGLQEAGYKGEILKYADMPAALTALVHRTVSGDVILIQNDWPDQYA